MSNLPPPVQTKPKDQIPVTTSSVPIYGSFTPTTQVIQQPIQQSLPIYTQPTTQIYQGATTTTNQVQYLQQSQLSQQVQAIRGESRIEYIPYERTVTEYEEVRRQVQVPMTRQITEYQAIQYETEYIPNVIQEKVIEYVPVERYAERVEYQTVTKQNVMSYPQESQYIQQSYAQPQYIQQSYVQPQIQIQPQPQIITAPKQYYVQPQPVTPPRPLLVQASPRQSLIAQSYIPQPQPVQYARPQPIYQPQYAAATVPIGPTYTQSYASFQPQVQQPIQYAVQPTTTRASQMPAAQPQQTVITTQTNKQGPIVTAAEPKRNDQKQDKNFLDKLFDY